MVKINKEQRIGNVIFIVEGKKTETKIIRDIFEKIYKFNVYQNNKSEDFIKMKKDTDVYSKVFIIVNNKPQLKRVLNETDYVEDVFKKLVNNNIDPYEAAIYYIFDRDDNDKNSIEVLMKKFNNSRESEDFDLHGLLLLSYPCIEAFYMNCYNDCIIINKSKELKTYVNKNRYKKIDEEKILCGVESMLRILNEDLMSGFTIDDLDNFENLNKTIFNKTEKFYEQNSYFKILSLLLVSLLDLGLVEI